jgi:hypothetical protein
MFNSTILDVGIGLVVVYLVASLGVTATNEFIAAWFKLRAKTLHAGIARLLQGDPTLVEKFFAHPLVKALSRDDAKPPSYIPARTFVLATVDAIGGQSGLAQRSVEGLIAGVGNKELGRVLRLFAGETKGDVDAMLARMERWYDESMDRVGGWYKRRVQLISLAVAAVITIAMNIDTVRIANVLWTSGPAREAVVSYAQVLQKQREAAPAAGANETPPAATGAGGVVEHFQELMKAGLPIGWQRCPHLNELPPSLPGWIVSALAISLGAPFWFDVLNRFMEVRSSGKTPKESPKPPEEKSEPLAAVMDRAPASGQPGGGAQSPPSGDATGGGPRPIAHQVFRR